VSRRDLEDYVVQRAKLPGSGLAAETGVQRSTEAVLDAKWTSSALV